MKLFTCFAMVLVLASCGNKADQTATESAKSAEPEAEAAAQPQDAIKEGEKLVAESDCKTCHHQVNKIIGPGHTEVAKKYEFTTANVKMLADRIIKGSSGVWGEIPMNPHADLSVEDAEKMARYVLSLDGETEK